MPVSLPRWIPRRRRQNIVIDPVPVTNREANKRDKQLKLDRGQQPIVYYSEQLGKKMIDFGFYVIPVSQATNEEKRRAGITDEDDQTGESSGL